MVIKVTCPSQERNGEYSTAAAADGDGDGDGDGEGVGET